MLIQQLCLRIVVLSCIFLLIGFNGYAQENLDRAEAVAKEYMTAFLQGDIEKAARLTHPDTLATLKQTLPTTGVLAENR